MLSTVTEVFVIEIGGETILWNVSAIREAANSGALGDPEPFLLCDFPPTEWSTGNISRERVEAIKRRPDVLDHPVFAIEAPPPNDDSLLCFCDGQHRVTARQELGLEEVMVFVVPWDAEQRFRFDL